MKNQQSISICFFTLTLLHAMSIITNVTGFLPTATFTQTNQQLTTTTTINRQYTTFQSAATSENTDTSSSSQQQDGGEEEEKEEAAFKQRIKQLCLERNYPFQKIKNARDLSSTTPSSPIQPNRIVRTGRISDATESDLAVLNNDIQIKTLVDLRSYTELKDDPVLDREEVFGEFKDLVWDERKNSVKVLGEGRSRVEKKKNIVGHVKELMSGAKKGVEVATHHQQQKSDHEGKDEGSITTPDSEGLIAVLSSAADLAEATDACKEGNCDDDNAVLSSDTILYENQEDEGEAKESSSSRFVKTYKCEDFFKDEARVNDKERHFVSIVNELKYVKGTLSKVRKRDLAKVIMKSPGAIVSKRVRNGCKEVFLDRINEGGLTLLNEILLKQAAPGIKFVLDLCKDKSRHPIAFYCTAGKDRTGAIAAIMLAAAGIPDEDIVEDYSLSANVYAEMNDHKAMVGALSQRNLDAKTFLGAPPEVMEKTLRNIKETYGGIEGYLDSIGFDEEDRKELRSALMD